MSEDIRTDNAAPRSACVNRGRVCVYVYMCVYAWRGCARARGRKEKKVWMSGWVGACYITQKSRQTNRKYNQQQKNTKREREAEWEWESESFQSIQFRDTHTGNIKPSTSRPSHPSTKQAILLYKEENTNKHKTQQNKRSGCVLLLPCLAFLLFLFSFLFVGGSCSSLSCLLWYIFLSFLLPSSPSFFL